MAYIVKMHSKPANPNDEPAVLTLRNDMSIWPDRMPIYSKSMQYKRYKTKAGAEKKRLEIERNNPNQKVWIEEVN